MNPIIGDKLSTEINHRETLSLIKGQVKENAIRFTQHFLIEMENDKISVDEILESLADPKIVEIYPEHKRGACCLLNGRTKRGKDLHLACTIGLPNLLLITVYPPKPPKWLTPFARSKPNEM